MTLPELAKYLHLGERTALKLATSKKLPGALIDGAWRFRPEAIDAWLEEQLVGESEDFEAIPDGMRVPLGDLLPDEGIIADMRAKDSLAAVEELAARAYHAGWLTDKPWFVGAVVEREALASTAMEGGVAFLHTRARDMGKISRPFIVFGRSYGGIDFGAPDGKPTHLLFLLGLKYDRLHLPVLGRLARSLRNPASVAKLRSTTSAQKMRNLLLKVDAAALDPTASRAVFTQPKTVLDREKRLKTIMRMSARKKVEAQREAARAQASAEPKPKRQRASAKKATTAKKTTTAKKPAAKKPAAKKPAVKKPAAKKPAAKKPAAKKPAKG